MKPAVWKRVSLGEHCEVFSGYAFKSRGFTDDPDDVHLIKGENVGQEKILWNISKRWPRSDASEFERFKLQPGDVVLAMDRPWVPAGLKFARIPDSAPDCFLVQRVARLRASKGLEQELLPFIIGSPDFVAYVQNVGRGVGVPHISSKEIGAFTFVLPPEGVQRRVAATLSAYDDLIENNGRRMALLEDAARLLYQEWFVRLCFPGHEHATITAGVPEGWERKKLGDVLTLKRGYDLPEAVRVPGDIPIVSSSGITGFHNAKKADAPGVVTGRYGTLGEVYFLDREYWPLNTALYVSDFKGNPPCFIAYFLKQTLQSIQSDKAAVPGLNRNVAHSLTVLWPSRSLRDQFDDSARLIYRQLGVLKETSQKLRAARDLLLPRLMNGEIAA